MMCDLYRSVRAVIRFSLFLCVAFILGLIQIIYGTLTRDYYTLTRKITLSKVQPSIDTNY